VLSILKDLKFMNDFMNVIDKKYILIN